MSVDAVHYGGPLVVTAGVSSFNLDGVESYNFSPALQEAILAAGGQVDQTYVATMHAGPMLSLTVNDIATALAMIGISGMPISATSTATAAAFFFTQGDFGGTRKTSTNHRKVTFNEGIVVPKSISWSQKQHATMQLEMYGTYDGTNAPAVYASGVALPHTPSVDELFVGGLVKINGTSLTGVQSVSIDFGLSVERLSGDGDVYDTFVVISDRKPRISITTKDITALSTYTLTGTPLSGSTKVFLQKMTEGGDRVSAATATHISFTINSGEIIADPFSGSSRESGGGGITIVPTYDGTNAVLVVSTSTAIS